MTIASFIAFCSGSALHQNLYHFTDRRNLPTINRDGLLATAELRRRGAAPIATGGNAASLEIDARSGMDEYVHLCFTRSHPLLYLAKQRGDIQDGVYVAISPQVMTIPGVKLCVGVAIATDAAVHPSSEVMNVIDTAVIYQRSDWKDPAVLARLRLMEKSEILVPAAVPRHLLLKTFNG